MKQNHRQADRIQFNPVTKIVTVKDSELGRKVDYPVDSCVLEIKQIDAPFVVSWSGDNEIEDLPVSMRNGKVLPAGEYLCCWFAWGGTGFSFYRSL